MRSRDRKRLVQGLVEELGLTDDEIRGYFTGPAHLPWHRMQNIDRWQGPLPVSWLDGQEELQRKIVRRERELGMRTVLPAFAGHVPQAIKRIFPTPDIRSLGEWAGFKEPYTYSFLNPMNTIIFKNPEKVSGGVGRDVWH